MTTEPSANVDGLVECMRHNLHALPNRFGNTEAGIQAAIYADALDHIAGPLNGDFGPVSDAEVVQHVRDVLKALEIFLFSESDPDAELRRITAHVTPTERNQP